MAVREFAAWLEGRHKEIMDCERRALERLDNGDKDGYASNMVEKAIKLKDLDRLAKPRLKDLPEGVRREVENRIARFSSGAATALSLESLFYMSALLYPDDYKEGEPDNLERLIMELDKKEAG